MKIITLLIAFLSFFALTAIPIFAYPLEMEILNNDQDVVIGSLVTYSIELTNNRNMVVPVRVSVDDSQYWIQNKYTLIDLQPESERIIEITFAPTGEKEGFFEFPISMWVFKENWIRVDDVIRMDVKLKFDLEDFYVDISGGNVNINLILDSTEERTVTANFDVTDSSGKVLYTFSETVTFSGLKTIQKSMPVSDFLAGKYTVYASVEETDLKEKTEFEIEPVHAVAETTKRISTVLYEDVIITIKNNGNLVEKNYKTFQTIPNNDWITGFVTEPSSCVVEGDNKVCGYVVTELPPGGSTMITYRLNYWMIYGQYAFIILIIIAIVTFSFIRITSPTITKRHAKKGEDKHSVILEIKNPFMHHLRNVIVRDWVSPLARVLHEEFEMVTPVIRKSDAGTEMIWKLGDIKPKETRIITYKIKTMVQGSLRMPRAYIRFNNNKGKKVRVFSKHLIVE